MIQYLKPVRSRHKPASLSLRSRQTTVAELLIWASALGLSAVVTPPAKAAVMHLLQAYRATPLLDWVDPQALAASVFILVFAGCALLLGLGAGAVLRITLGRKRLRRSAASAFYPGPGLRGHPRLEP